MQSYALCRVTRCVSSQVTLIYIALLTIQIESKQLHNIKIGTIKSNVVVCVCVVCERERERDREEKSERQRQIRERERERDRERESERERER